MATPILDITELFNGQKNQFATANEAFRNLESAANDLLSVDLSSGDEVIGANEFRRHFLFSATGNSVERSLTVPQVKRFFAVRNAGSEVLTVVRGTSEHDVQPETAAIFYADGTGDGLTAIASGGGGGSGGSYADAAVSSNTLDLSGLGLSVDVVRVDVDQDITTINIPSADPDTYRELFILFTQDNVGGHSVSGWSGVSWEGGSAPAIDSAADTVTAVALVIFGDSVVYGG